LSASWLPYTDFSYFFPCSLWAASLAMLFMYIEFSLIFLDVLILFTSLSVGVHSSCTLDLMF
jgi:hypothetical protein